MRRFLTLLALIILLTGCGDNLTWQTKDISGLLPKLEFTLTSETGNPVTAAHYAGDVTLLFFGYTHCPDVCPLTLAHLRGVIERLPATVARQVRVLFVSVDPKRDDPKALRAYTDAFGKKFIGLTGTQEQLKTLTRRYRTTYGYGEPDAQGNYEVSHGSAVYAFDPDGEARLLIRRSDSLEAIAADLTQLVHSDRA